MTTLDAALYAALVAAAAPDTSEVYQDEAPEDATFPHVVFQQVAAPDAYTFTRRIKTVTLMQVTVYDLGHDKTKANAILARIDAALNDQPLGGVTGHKQTRRDDSFSLTWRVNGQSGPQVGGNYRITVST